MHRLYLLVFVGVLYVVVLSGCGSDSNENPTSTQPAVTQEVTADAPELLAARAWLDAVTSLDGNAILKHTCLEQRDNIQEITAWATALPVLGTILRSQDVNVQGDISDVSFETSIKTEAFAEIYAFGELRMAVSAMADAQIVDEHWFMVFENDTWRWCGQINGQIALPEVKESISVDQQIEGSALPQARDNTNVEQQPTNLPTPLEPNVSGREKRIAFTSDFEFPSDAPPKNGVIHITKDVYVWHEDGTIQRLTNTLDWDDSYVTWSPNGNQIAFESYLPGEFTSSAIFVVNADGTNLRQLTQHIPAMYPTWSPNSDQIAFVCAETMSLAEMCVINSDGSGFRFLTKENFSRLLWPAWSPNGEDIAVFAPDEDKTYIVKANGSGVTEFPYDVSAWSPDGKEILSVKLAEGGSLQIYRVNIETGSVQQLTWDDSYNAFPSWSPDGTEIVYISSIALSLINTDGSNQRQLTDIHLMNVAFPRWAPR